MVFEVLGTAMAVATDRVSNGAIDAHMDNAMALERV